jgi:hypothetical protein
MTLERGASLSDVAFAVCTALHRAGIEAVLTGGSAATFYVPTVFQSADADFVLRYGSEGKAVLAALATIGFRRRPSGDFDHPNLQYTLEFPAGPLSIGSDLITSWCTERRDDEILHVLSPTDVVRDRFLHFYAWPDLSAYSAAVAIARAMYDSIEWNAFEAWARREAAADRTYDVLRLERFLREVRRPG